MQPASQVQTDFRLDERLHITPARIDTRDRATQWKRNELVAGLVAYGLGVLVSLLLWCATGATPAEHPLVLLVVAAGLFVPIGWFLTFRRAQRPGFLLAALFGLTAVGVLVGLGRGAVTPHSYSDSIAGFLDQGYLFPRWLLGMALAMWMYVGFWQFPPVAAAVPAALHTTPIFVALLNTIAIGLASVLLLRRWPGRLAVILPLLTPVWMLFGSGYTEYYPLAMGAFIGCLAWLFERPLDERPAWMLGVVVALLPLSYLGFALLGLGLLAVLAVSRPRDFGTTAIVAAIVFAVTVAATWGNVAAYLKTLYGEMNFGDTFTSFHRYQRRAAGPASIFFKSRYALSGEHLWDVGYMLSWGGGWLLLPALVAALALAARRFRFSMWKDARLWLAVVFVGVQVYYLLFMIPKLGPTNDTDLFTTTYLTLAFMTGGLYDAVDLGPHKRYLLICALAGVAVTTGTVLGWTAVPPRP